MILVGLFNCGKRAGLRLLVAILFKDSVEGGGGDALAGRGIDLPTDQRLGRDSRGDVGHRFEGFPGGGVLGDCGGTSGLCGDDERI